MTDNNLCDSCANKWCMFQSGIVRQECAFYKPKIETLSELKPTYNQTSIAEVFIMNAIQYLQTKDEMCKNTNCVDCQYHYWDRGASVDGDISCCNFDELPYEKRVEVVKEWGESNLIR